MLVVFELARSSLQRRTQVRFQAAVRVYVRVIEVQDAATPLTNIYYTGNPEGAIYGYQQSLDNAYMNRLKNSTPFKGLYLASAWTTPGGGFQPCLESGAMAFRALIKDWAGTKR